MVNHESLNLVQMNLKVICDSSVFFEIMIDSNGSKGSAVLFKKVVQGSQVGMLLEDDGGRVFQALGNLGSDKVGD